MTIYHTAIELNAEYKDFLWTIQQNPIFKRSTSMVLSNMVNFPKISDEEIRFHNDFGDQLENKNDNLSKIPDRNVFIKALFYAYGKQKPDLKEKLQFLKAHELLNNKINIFDLWFKLS